MKTKIYIRLKGGLGNQLFQFAFGLYLNKIGLPIIGYHADYSHDTYGHDFQLHNIIPNDKIFICNIPDSTILIQSESAESIKKYITEQSPKSVLIDGYFQNVNYVEQSELNKIIKRKTDVNPLTAIHIRRGDYGHHGHLPIIYYTEALSHLGLPDFEVFSDEPNFSEYMFSRVPGFQRVIRPNIKNPSDELVSLAAHASVVMANSSFSWMASYLAYKNYNSGIVFPKPWSFIGEAPGAFQDWHSIDSRLITP